MQPLDLAMVSAFKHARDALVFRTPCSQVFAPLCIPNACRASSMQHTCAARTTCRRVLTAASCLFKSTCDSHVLKLALTKSSLGVVSAGAHSNDLSCLTARACGLSPQHSSLSPPTDTNSTTDYDHPRVCNVVLSFQLVGMPRELSSVFH